MIASSKCGKETPEANHDRSLRHGLAKLWAETAPIEAISERVSRID